MFIFEEATWTARLPKQLRLLVLTSLLPSPPYKLPIELGEFVRPGHILMQHDDPISLLTLTHPFPPILYRSFILTLNPTYSFFSSFMAFYLSYMLCGNEYGELPRILQVKIRSTTPRAGSSSVYVYFG